MKKAVMLSILLLNSFLYAAEQKCVLTIEGMGIDHCVSAVKTALEKVDGVQSAEVTLKPGSATVVYLAEKTNEPALIKAVGDVGFKAAAQTAEVATSVANEEAKTEDMAAGEIKTESENATGKTEAETKQAEAKVASKGEPSCPAVKAAAVKESTAKTEADAGMPPCATKKQCKELTQFHAAMHPIAVATGYEGDGKVDYAKVRKLYPNLKAKTELLVKMPIDDKIISDLKAFTDQRMALVNAVDEFGAACQGKDNSKITPAFEKVHDGYIKLAGLAK